MTHPESAPDTPVVETPAAKRSPITHPPRLEDCEIRLLQTKELGLYKALRDSALKQHPEAFTSDHATEVKRDASSYASRLGSAQSGNFTLGAFDACNVLVGAISLDRPARLQLRHNANVVGLMVSLHAQWRGVGRVLVRALPPYARQCTELHTLTLSVTATNLHAIRLYSEIGFTQYGLQPRAIAIAGVSGPDGLEVLNFHDKALMHLNLKG